MNDKTFQELINWKPHAKQREVIEGTSRERVICAGRRGGKSALCGYVAAKRFFELFEEVREGKRESVKIWVVAPSYELSRKVFEYIVNFLRKLDKSIDGYLTERPAPQIKISEKSADEPKSLLGEELDLLIIDEAANISQKIWFDYLLPTTASKTRQGRTIFISTPRGKNWFHDLYIKAKEYKGAFHWTSLEGVEIDTGEWERLKKASPQDFFQQNYEATFLEEAASVFRHVKDCIVPDCLQEPQRDHTYVMGLDLAQIGDYTAMVIADRADHHIVYKDRFHKISYPLQIDRIEKAALKYGHALIIVDVNNVGAAVSDELQARGCRVQDFKIVGTISKDITKVGSKEKMINKLAVDVENRNIFYPAYQILIDEMESFGYNITSSGNFRYGAPEGMHDDMVIALALANWGLMGKRRTQNAEVARLIPHKKKVFQYY
jgi:hypothetical protein